ncbi:MAG: YCF48-related protein, partial [Ignavibacteriae bacterium]|nr:YCF48-related protein [Ignavibacteriota bacterium]
MKKILLSLLLVFLFSLFTDAQWSIQYTSNPSQTIMCLKFFDNNTGYHSGILYNSSTLNIYKTTNGGINYTAQNSNYTAQRFMSIFMIHPDTVFISGNYGKILRTVNGGSNWIPYIYSDTTIQFWGLYFVNSLTGFVAGSSGKILKTTNKGDNWNLLTTPTSTALDGIYFVNENTGYVGGANIFLKTTDAGATWVNKVGSFISPFETAQSVYFSDANTGYYCTNTSNCRIVKTTDGGDTWNLINNMTDIGAGWDMSFTNAMTGYVCTGTGKVLKTTDAGVTWGVQNTPLTENLYAMHFPSANTGYIASWSGKILKTTNGGLSFITKSENETAADYLLGQNFPNPFNP